MTEIVYGSLSRSNTHEPLGSRIRFFSASSTGRRYRKKIGSADLVLSYYN